MLVCPDCNNILITETVPTDAPGGSVDIDRCAYCGGVWFDHFEINRFPTYYAARLSGQASSGDLKKLVGGHLCPHCGIALKRLYASSVDKTLHVFVCPHCRGHWVSKKELVRVKQHQSDLLTRFKSLPIPVMPSIYSVLIPVLLISIMSATTLAMVAYTRRVQETRIRAQELISNPVVIPVSNPPEPVSVLVSFSTNQAVTSDLIYKSNQRFKPVKVTVNSSPQLIHTVKLTGLLPQTTYTYTLHVVDENGVITDSKEHEFKTP